MSWYEALGSKALLTRAIDGVNDRFGSWNRPRAMNVPDSAGSEAGQAGANRPSLLRTTAVAPVVAAMVRVVSVRAEIG
jgi:hypothetical protein